MGTKVYIAHPSVVALAGCTVNGYGTWTDVTTVNFFEIQTQSISESIVMDFKQSNLPRDKQIHTSQGKSNQSIILTNMLVGSMDDIETRRFRNALYYAKTVWAQHTNKYCLLFRGDSTASELGSSLTDTNSDRWSVLRGNVFVRPKGTIKDVQFEEDYNNNLILKKLTILLGGT